MQQRCFAHILELIYCVSKVSRRPFVLSFEIAVSRFLLVSKAGVEICATLTEHKQEMSTQRVFISETFSNSFSQIGEGDIIQNQFDINLFEQ